MARENYLVFARKWRPQSFEDVVGQEHITRTLQNAIGSERIAHAFLFIGSRGIGKTTTARVLAKALNCLAAEKPTVTPCNSCDNCRAISEGNSMDVIEIDGASNNSVDDVREIREHVRLVPSRSRYKIYIIDEVHQLSAGAFNALLKTIEEPPPHALFILATTEAHKVPATIVSRCQRFDFRRVPIPEIVRLLRQILDKEGIGYTEEALFAVARAAEGGVRDAESILDQLVSYAEGEITFQHVFDVLGLVDWQALHQLCDAILDKDIARLLALVEDVVSSGKDLGQFVQEILRYFRNLLVCKTAEPGPLLGLPEEETALMQAQADRFTLTHIIRLVEHFAELTKAFDSQLAQRIALEALLIRISKRTVETSIDALIEKLIMLAEDGGKLAEDGGKLAEDGGKLAEDGGKLAEDGGKLAAGCEMRGENGESAPPQHAPGDGPGALLAPKAEVVNAEPEKLTVDLENIGTILPRIAEMAEVDMATRVGISGATPQAIEDEVLVLRFNPNAPQPKAAIERPESRQAIETALKNITTNIVSFRCEFGEPPQPGNQHDNPLEKEMPVGPGLSVEQARDALEDPHVAKVIEVFKGRIVDIQKPKSDCD